ncbi:MAG: T9SS type A sorting domain-containing protein [Flavobacteriales bacterium]|nr:T9SS type A sorting domain-containing protein [Flavobacteriales bacterium]
MKKPILFLVLSFFLSTVIGQNADTVITGANYTNRVFYSLDNDDILSTPVNDWDIALACYGPGAAGSAILINEAACFLYNTPYDTGAWSTFDTIGAYTWKQLLNSDTSWTNGAFNTYRGTAGLFDMGWGILNPNNNHWTFGDSIYLVKTHDGSFKKLVITSLKTGVWTITYANLNGTNPQTVSITKANYPKRNFIYYSLVNHQIIDKEPDNDTWELLFQKHRDWVSNMYVSVSGVLKNRNIWSAKAHLPSFNDAMNTTAAQTSFNKNVVDIGYEWKKYNSQTGWKVYDTIAYFIYNIDSSMFYRIVFTDFGGSANGHFIFNKTLIKNLAINEPNNTLKNISTYPNPSNGQFNLLYEALENTVGNIAVYSIQGVLVHSEKINFTKGIYMHAINAENLCKGVYLLVLETTYSKHTSKLIIE